MSRSASSSATEARIRVRVTPRASRERIRGWEDGLLRVSVTAAPVGGQANAALERLLAKALGVPRSAVRVVSGERAREKIVAVADLGTDDALARLRAAAER